MRRTWLELALSLGLAALLGCGPGPVNGCEAASAVDARGRAEVEIGFGGRYGYNYEPSCLRVDPGTRVRFHGPFAVHPLGAGAFRDGGLVPEDGSPIPTLAAGEEVVVVLREPGSYPFFCQYHVGEGMFGAIFVEE